MSIMKSSCIWLILAVAGVACHTRPPATSSRAEAPSPAVSTRPTEPPPPPAPAPSPVVTREAPPLTEAELFGRKSLSDLNAEHPLGDAFFDYDQNALRDDAKPALQQDAQWLAKWPQAKVRVEGYCDERGTPEYNLALGDKRAEVVKQYLTSLGVSSDRIQTRSLGKEAVFCHESAESCWSQNRRGHFVITEK
jgi:peptidoglycan-associated lipoprotein